MKKPESLTFAQAASVPEVWLTAFQLLFVVAAVKKGDKVLIHAAASGVGCAAIQLARHAGADVFTTASSDFKIEFTKSLGANLGGAVVAREGGWAQDFPGDLKFDIILDCVGGSYARDNLEVLATDGTWILYSLLGGGDLGDDLLKGKLLGTLLAKRGSLKATLLRGRSVDYKANLVNRLRFAKVLDNLDDGTFKLIVDKTFSGLSQAQAAHDYMESNANLGKIVIELTPDDHLATSEPTADDTAADA
mmetsp:Transcript_4185/g.13002  ORF Transcript_4185/g.13002 Transcript_4185/m.13002 type:complete len:248 (+) Transcript_4185:2-745(+)